MKTSTIGDPRQDPEDVDPEWLTSALEAGGIAKGATITNVCFDGLIGTGQTGRNARFLLNWDDSEGRPASVVGKFASADPSTRDGAFERGTYQREWNFYVNVAPTVRVRAPQCYVALHDAEHSGFVLIMEDLAGSAQGDQFVGLTVEEAELAMTQAVALHAPRWGDPTVQQLFGEGDLLPAERAERSTMFYDFTLEPCIAQLGSRLEPDTIDLCRRFKSTIGAWTLGNDSPQTIVHYDFRPDNLLFGQSPTAPPLVVVDWQTVNAGLGMTDVAYLIGGGFLPTQRAVVERDLVESYREQLTATGIEYNADTCWRDYRFGSLWGLIISVIATIAAAQTERGDDMLATMANRHARHALDLDALSLLE